MLSKELREKYLKNSLLYQVHLDLTYRCNLRCEHCYIDERHLNEMPFERIKRLIDEMFEMKTLILTLSGGELFLRHDLFEIIEHARSRKFGVKIKTSGTLLDEDRCAKLKRLGVLQVEISVYSLGEAVHDSLTKVSGSLSRSLQAIEALRKQGVRVRVNYTATKKNLEDLRGIRDFFESRGIEVSAGTIVYPLLRGGLKPVMLNISSEQRRRLSGGSAGNNGNSVKFDPHSPICNAGRTSLYIAPDGVVYPCVVWQRPLGSVMGSSLKTIWEKSFELERIRSLKMSDMMPLKRNSPFDTFCPGLLNA